MNKETQKARVYEGHRLRQQERILSVAETLFCTQGIAHVGLNDIADAARVTRTTIYRYYANKSDIVLAVFERCMVGCYNQLPATVWDESLRGSVRLHALLHSFCDYYFANPLRAMFYVDFYRTFVNNVDANRLQGTLTNLSSKDALIGTLLEVGIQDGSLRPDLSVPLIHTMLISVLYGLEQRLSQFGGDTQATRAHAAHDIYRSAVDVLMHGLMQR